MTLSSPAPSTALDRASPRHALRRCAVLIVLALLAAGCSGEVMHPAGDIARQQRDIIVISTALMLLIIVPVMVLIVVFAWRYRKGGGGRYDAGFDHSTGLELLIWSAPLLIIIALGALTWSSTHLLDPYRRLPAKAGTVAPAPMVVQVVSLDWKWLFIYPEQGIATVNELVIPVDREVRFDITSSNMMNTFYAPTLAGMIYAMPGMQSQMHAVLRRPGTYKGYSANYSGAGFSDMHFRLVGVDDAGFAAFVGAAKAGPQALTLAGYRTLAEPSEKVPARRFSAVDAGLYRRILERCVADGSVCMSETMQHGHRASPGRTMPPGMAMPPRGGSVPADRAKGALEQTPREIQPVPYRDKRAAPEQAPGASDPGNAQNRTMS